MMVARSQSTMHNGAKRGGGVGHSTVAGGGHRTGRPWRAGLELGRRRQDKTGLSRNVFILGVEADCRASVTPKRSKEEMRTGARAGRGLGAGDKVDQCPLGRRVDGSQRSRRQQTRESTEEMRGADGGQAPPPRSADATRNRGGMWTTEAWRTIHWEAWGESA